MQATDKVLFSSNFPPPDVFISAVVKSIFGRWLKRSAGATSGDRAGVWVWVGSDKNSVAQTCWIQRVVGGDHHNNCDSVSTRPCYYGVMVGDSGGKHSSTVWKPARRYSVEK